MNVPAAIGSGSLLALGAMEAGVSPEQAVGIAAKRDIGTGGKITVLHLDGHQ
jgi:ATP-dependent protease HslVU (ClpYQ) peptidase subunit